MFDVFKIGHVLRRVEDGAKDFSRFALCGKTAHGGRVSNEPTAALYSESERQVQEACRISGLGKGNGRIR
jgi:hypothetical protein